MTAPIDFPPFYERFRGWLADENRKPAAAAFTAGLLRDAASAVEDCHLLARISSLESELEEQKAENQRLRADLENALTAIALEGDKPALQAFGDAAAVLVERDTLRDALAAVLNQLDYLQELWGKDAVTERFAQTVRAALSGEADGD